MAADENNNELDIDYVLLTGILAGALAILATTATILAKPVLIELGKQLPLPNLSELFNKK